MELSNRDFRAMIFYDFKRGLSYHESFDTLRTTFGDKSPSIATIHFWFREFKRGRKTLEDDPRPGRPTSVANDENARAVDKVIRDQRNITLRGIKDKVGFSTASIRKILRDRLHARKLVSRWIPHLLTPDQKEARVKWCQEMLKKFDRGRSKRTDDIVTGDETWIYCYEPESKQQSRVWVFDDEPRPTKLKRSRCVAKQMVAVFVRKFGVVAAIPLEPGKTVNAQWYANTCLPEVFKQLRATRPKTGLRGLLLHHDNARAHTAAFTLGFLDKAGVKLLRHPPYSPDLAPCDFYVFRELKRRLRGKRFESPKEAIDAMNVILGDMSKESFKDCFDKWFQRMDKCIRVNGEYFEKL